VRASRRRDRGRARRPVSHRPLELRSGVELHLEPGARLEAAEDINLYIPRGAVTSEGSSRRGMPRTSPSRAWAPLTARAPRSCSPSARGWRTPPANTRARAQPAASRHRGSDASRPSAGKPGAVLQMPQHYAGRRDAPRLAGVDRALERVRRRVRARLRILNPPSVPNNDGIHCVTSRNSASRTATSARAMMRSPSPACGANRVRSVPTLW